MIILTADQIKFQIFISSIVPLRGFSAATTGIQMSVLTGIVILPFG
jgi:hypothetical protein